MAKGKNEQPGELVPGAGGDAGEDSGVGAVTDVAGIPIATLPSTGGDNTGDTVKRGRGRPAGTGNGNKRPTGKREKASQTTVKGIEKILFSIHAMAAAGLNIQELAIDESEAALLSDAVTEVSSHYNTVIDPKVIAWVGLIGVCGKIYAPRIATIKMRKAMEKSSASAE